MDAVRKFFHIKQNVTTASSLSPSRNKIELNDDESMRLWMSLPYEIRQDVSLASFQVPNQHDNNHQHQLTIQSDDNDESFQTSIGEFSDNAPETTTNDMHDTKNRSSTKTYSKIVSLMIVWLFLTIILSQSDEKSLPKRHLIVPPHNNVKYFQIPEQPIGSQFLIKLQGAFDGTRKNFSANDLIVTIEQMNETVGIWKLPLIDAKDANVVFPTTRQKVFAISDQENVRLIMKTNLPDEFPFMLTYDVSPPNLNSGIIYGASILIILYILIIFEIVHRTFAAMLASCSGIAVLAMLNDRPTMTEIFIWIDIETLLLLFSMMILVAVLAETGVFDVIAVFAYKTTRGKIWPLIYCLCIASALISSVLDNVTTILLMVPLVIRLCQVMHLNPKPILIAVVLYTNIGGTMTPVGGPPNIMITSNPVVAQKGISFLSFTGHMSIGAILLMLQTAIQLQFQYSKNNQMKLNESRECQNLRQQINVWKMALENIKAMSTAGNLVANTLRSKIKFMTRKLKKMERSGTESKEAYEITLHELKEQYKIKNKPLLFKSGFVFLFVISLFLFESIPQFHTLSMGWCALLGVMLLLIIYDRNDFDTMINRIEWSTLLFFAGMFVTMECLARLGLVNWIGQQAELVILSVDKNLQLSVAIVIILWVSAITSSFVDAIPVTAMMLKVVIMLSQNPELSLPIQPLLWALAYGPSIGGNGTLYGASANTVCACVAGRFGHKIGFIEYVKVCYPIMIGNILVLTGYLMTAHVFFQWHSN